jgi:Zc3h12a-like Ribonuclease NYN domain/S1 RNA binding domain
MPVALRNHVVVDGSNLATEGRTAPSLVQLQEAVAAFRAENPGAAVTVVVDASFAHRIDASERDRYEAAVAAGELVSPPAGAIGRGDGFLLQIADRTGGAVLSNDSFQEFHGTYDWLFDTGRLIGAKPVPGVGWIFSLRTPVRGDRSRKAVREAERDAEPKTPKVVQAAIKEATADALEPDSPKRRRRKGKGKGKEQSPAPGTVNEPDPFLRFVASHPPGSEVEGRVDSYASHGAFVDVDGVRGYVPLTGMGDPAPASAREMLRKGDVRTFTVQAVDAPRRGVELAIPAFVHISGVPTEETVEAGIQEGSARTRRRRRQRKAAKMQARSKPKAEKKANTPAKARTQAKPKKETAPAKKAKKSSSRRGS